MRMHQRQTRSLLVAVPACTVPDYQRSVYPWNGVGANQWNESSTFFKLTAESEDATQSNESSKLNVQSLFE